MRCQVANGEASGEAGSQGSQSGRQERLDGWVLRTSRTGVVASGRNGQREELSGKAEAVNKERRAKAAPAIFASYMPKASAQESHQSNRPRLDNALLALRKDSRVLRHRRAFADCFGANPVASALGSSTGRDLRALRIEHITGGRSGCSKPERSTLL